MAQWIAPLPRLNRKVLVCSARVHVGFQGYVFLPLSRDMERPPSVLYESVSEWCVGPAMDWGPVQSVLLPLTHCML